MCRRRRNKAVEYGKMARGRYNGCGIDAGLGLGEGTGAVMLFSLLDLALALYEDQTTFDTMEIAQYERYGETE